MHIKIVVLFLGSLSLNAIGAAKEQIDQKKEAAKTKAIISLTKKAASVPPVQTQRILKFACDDDFEDEMLEVFLASRPDLVFEPSVQENTNDVLKAFLGVGNKK